MIGWFFFAMYAITIPVANWLIVNVGTTCIDNGPCIVPVGFGLFAPSGVLVIGFSLVFRDIVQEYLGAKISVTAVIIGAILSAVTSNHHIAIASALAFLIAELFDFFIYSKLRNKGFEVAAIASGIVGAVIDSMLFVYVAFGSFDLSLGTSIAKIYASVAVASIYFIYNRVVKK